MSDFKAKVHQIRFWLGLHLRLHWGAYSVYSPTALAGGEEFAAPFSITHLLLSALRGPNFVHVGLEKVFLIRSSPLPTIYGSATDCGHQQGRGGSTLGPGGTGPPKCWQAPTPPNILVPTAKYALLKSRLFLYSGEINTRINN